MSGAQRLGGIGACVFDAYGTLFDVHAPVARVAGRIGPEAEALSRLWRAKQLEYTWLRSLMGAHADFAAVTGDALAFALAAHGIADAALERDLLALYQTLDAYDDARRALAALKDRCIATAILSNGSPAMLESAVRSAGLAPLLDHVLSVEEVGVFKPDPRVYRLAVERLALAPQAICFVSANGWDAAGAAHFGLTVVWLNRFAMTRERLPGAPRAVITGLDELTPLVG